MEPLDLPPLHVEVSNVASPAWVCTYTAKPGPSGNPDDGLAKDNLQAHYGEGFCKVGRKVQYDGQSPIYFSPGEVFAQSELLPYLSISNPTPSFDDFDVYGIANQPLYGQLQMHRDNSKSFQGVGILIKGGTDRQNPLNTPPLGNSKWLARTWASDVDYNNSSVTPVAIKGDFPITGDHSYTQTGDYQFMSFVAETTKNLKKGYPIVFSLLDSARSKIIDNDKTTEKQVDNSMRKIYSQSLGSSELASKDNTIPGYYLTSQLVRGQGDAYAQWKPGLVGNYRMYAFVPSGSSGKKIVYKIKEDGTKATMKAACVAQENQGGYWAPLVWSELTDNDGNGRVDIDDLACQGGASSTEATVFNLQDKNGDGWGDGYVGLVLSKTATNTVNSPTSNAHLTDQDWVSFDAIKFEQANNVDSTWTFNPTTNHYYKVFDCGNWEQCEAQAVGIGAHLVTINDQAENDWLVNTFGTTYFWIGFSDYQQEGNWIWASGEPVTYTNWNWQESEPNGGTLENYAHLNWGHVGGWNDTSINAGGTTTQAIIELVP